MANNKPSILILAPLLALLFVFSLVGCSTSPTDQTQPPAPQLPQENVTDVPAQPTPAPDIANGTAPAQEPAAPPAPTPSPTVINETLATLYVSAYPNPSELFLNNVSKGETPITVENVTPGDYLLKVTRSGYWPYSINVKIAPGEAKNISVLLRRFKSD